MDEGLVDVELRFGHFHSAPGHALDGEEVVGIGHQMDRKESGKGGRGGREGKGGREEREGKVRGVKIQDCFNTNFGGINMDSICGYIK